MASKTLIEFIDDLDGSPATQTVTFAVDGVTYEIDLNDPNAAQLREDINRWTEHGRRVGGRRARHRRPAGHGRRRHQPGERTIFRQ